MKRVLTILSLVLGLMLGMTSAQTYYPGTTPVQFVNIVPTAATFTATGTKIFVMAGQNSISVRLTSNTFTSMTAALQGSNEPVATSEANSNWSPIRLIPAVGGIPINSISTATGFWKANVAGYTKVRINVSALSATSVTFQVAANAATDLNAQSQFGMGTLSAAVATNTTTQVVAVPPAGTSILLHSVLLEKATATTGQVTVIYGTGANCGTGTTTLTTLGPQTATSLLPVGPYLLDVAIPAGNALCLQTDAATTSARVVTQ